MRKHTRLRLLIILWTLFVNIFPGANSWRRQHIDELKRQLQFETKP